MKCGWKHPFSCIHRGLGQWRTPRRLWFSILRKVAWFNKIMCYMLHYNIGWLLLGFIARNIAQRCSQEYSVKRWFFNFNNNDKLFSTLLKHCSKERPLKYKMRNWQQHSPVLLRILPQHTSNILVLLLHWHDEKVNDWWHMTTTASLYRCINLFVFTPCSLLTHRLVETVA